MLDRYLPVFGIAGITLLVGGYMFVVAPAEAAHKDSLTFSNTATWDPELAALSQEPLHYPAELFTSMTLPPPPKNSSAEVAEELKMLTSYENLRTPEEVQDILSERDFSTLEFGGHTAASYKDGGQFPATALLLKESFHDLTVITLQQKKKFDRVRPSALDPNLTTTILVPGHPAYPSGHSTQMHFLAYVFGELSPARADEFLARADEVAKNREVAGLHYPSDTQAGILLAKQFFAIMMAEPKFQKLLVAAKTEWR